MNVRQNRVKPTEKQSKAINGVLTGKKPTQAMTEAGYSPKTASHARQNFFQSRGVAKYLAEMDKKSRELFKMNLGDKLVEVYLKGLEASKLHGRNAVEHPDYLTQLAYADKISELVGWTKEEKTQIFNNQYNFFSFPQEERGGFNKAFDRFMRNYYKT